MLKPKYLEQLPNRMIELYSQVEMDIIAEMALRLLNMDFIPSVEWRYKKLIEMGNFHSWIMEALSAQTGFTRLEIERLMEEAGAKAIRLDSDVYRRAGLNPPPLASSPSMQAVLRAGIENTGGLFDNLTRTTADTATKQFEDALDRAWLQITSGAFDRNSAVKMAVKDLADKGVASITYPSGHKDYLDVAVRRAVVTGVNQTSLQLSDTLAAEMDSDLVDVTAHAGARSKGTGPANHAEWQGKRYSRSGRHPNYPSLTEVTGYGTGAGLGGWNCRHNMFPAFEGMDPVYTDPELAELNAPKYEYNGQKLTEEEAQDSQRNIERHIRKWKREYTGMEVAGLPTDEAAAKIAKWNATQKDFLEQTGLKRQADRENVVSFTKEQAAKASRQARQAEKLAKQTEIAYNKKQEDVRKLIRSDELPKTLNIGNQNKHIPGSEGYIPGRSYIYGDLASAQELIFRHSGKGEIRLYDGKEWNKKEFVYVDRDIGVKVNPDTGEGAPTNGFSIHYGKRGTHIVPANRRDTD